MNVFESNSEVRYLKCPEGQIAYELAGDGPLIVCVPGMGDLRATYRFIAPQLVAAGYRVAVTELRGHGDSDATFADYGDEATATDIAALIWELGGPALIVGNSMAAASGILVAAQHPELVRGLALLGPFAREPRTSAVMGLIMRAALAPAWAAMSWNSYLPKLYAGTLPADFAQYRKAVVAAIKKRGYARAFSLTTRTNHDVAEQALPDVAAPALVVMGEQDPDFKDPAAEARWICDQLDGELVMVPASGHYPQSQRPELVGPAIVAFAHKVMPVSPSA
jgi:pimeloyl-ACP methyl ester carboxylesterase